jgi:hypothetical protein
MREETYREDKLDGETLWWDATGELLMRGTYQDGKPWSGQFPERSSEPGSVWMINTYEDGKKVRDETLTAPWWW